MKKLKKQVSAIIQARLTSKRFPAKVTAFVNGKTVLGLIIDKLHQCQNLDKICLAIPNNDSNDSLVAFSKEYRVDVYRGNEKDVMSRIIDTAYTNHIEHILRVCADSPFVQTWLIDYAIDKYQTRNVDYFYSTGMPAGMNIEIFSLKGLQEAYKLSDEEEREHVTLYFERHLKDFKTHNLKLDNFTVDYEKDLKRLKQYAKYGL